MAPKIDLYQKVTDQIIAAMEKGKMPWQRDWKTDGAGAMTMPRRATGEFYRGINVILLWIESMEKGYTATHWMTFKQAKEKGGCVRKGEKGTKIVFFNMLKKEDKETGNEIKIPFLKEYTVFNADQIDGLPAQFYAAPVVAEETETGPDAVASLETFFAATGARIVTKGNQPCYRPAIDQIEMPPLADFFSADSYYGTLAHETIHWTGHASRLDRLGSAKKEDYAFEELIAEMGSVFLCSVIGATPNFDNSAAYLHGWLAALRNDKKYIFKAATAAQKASDFTLDCAGHETPQAQAA